MQYSKHGEMIRTNRQLKKREMQGTVVTLSKNNSQMIQIWNNGCESILET